MAGEREERAKRAFMCRAARFLAMEQGVEQYLGIGTGIPTSPTLHEVVQKIIPEARIVYLDNDPAVLARARALPDSDPRGATTYLDGDLRDIDRILEGAAGTLDFSRPVALLLVEATHDVPEADDPYGIVTRLVDALAPGSFLALSQPGKDLQAEVAAAGAEPMRQLSSQITPRTREEVARFFDGLDMIAPGLVQTTAWRPTANDDDLDGKATTWAGVARKR
jgi:trans-aconitate methyltransferase